MDVSSVSVLTNQLNKLEALNHSDRRSRCAFIFTISSDIAKEEIFSWLKQQVEHYKSLITGLFIAHKEDNSGIFIIEAMEDVMHSFLRDLDGVTEDYNNSFFEEGKILLFFDDCPYSIFPKFDTFSIFRPKEQEVIFPEGIPIAAEAVYNDILALGAELLNLDDRNYGIAKENLSTGRNCSEYLKKLPSHERISKFLESEDLFSLSQFVELFSLPIGILLSYILEESFIKDNIWPEQYNIPTWLLDTTQPNP